MYIYIYSFCFLHLKNIIATNALKTLSVSQRAMSTEAIRNIDDIKDITVKPNNSAGNMEINI